MGHRGSCFDLGQEEKGTTEDEMVGWHHRLSGQELEQTLGNSEGQGNLRSCSPHGHRLRYDLVTEQQQQAHPQFVLGYFSFPLSAIDKTTASEIQ